MPQEPYREPINWRQELKDLFLDEALVILQEVVTEIRENLKTGKVDTERLVSPEIRELRSEIFGDELHDGSDFMPPESSPSWLEDDE